MVNIWYFCNSHANIQHAIWYTSNNRGSHMMYAPGEAQRRLWCMLQVVLRLKHLYMAWCPSRTYGVQQLPLVSKGYILQRLEFMYFPNMWDSALCIGLKYTVKNRHFFFLHQVVPVLWWGQHKVAAPHFDISRFQSTKDRCIYRFLFYTLQHCVHSYILVFHTSHFGVL